VGLFDFQSRKEPRTRLLRLVRQVPYALMIYDHSRLGARDVQVFVTPQIQPWFEWRLNFDALPEQTYLPGLA
jgi:hypothetical protein